MAGVMKYSWLILHSCAIVSHLALYVVGQIHALTNVSGEGLWSFAPALIGIYGTLIHIVWLVGLFGVGWRGERPTGSWIRTNRHMTVFAYFALVFDLFCVVYYANGGHSDILLASAVATGGGASALTLSWITLPKVEDEHAAEVGIPLDQFSNGTSRS